MRQGRVLFWYCACAFIFILSVMGIPDSAALIETSPTHSYDEGTLAFSGYGYITRLPFQRVMTLKSPKMGENILKMRVELSACTSMDCVPEISSLSVLRQEGNAQREYLLQNINTVVDTAGNTSGLGLVYTQGVLIGMVDMKKGEASVCAPWDDQYTFSHACELKFTEKGNVYLAVPALKTFAQTSDVISVLDDEGLKYGSTLNRVSVGMQKVGDVVFIPFRYGASDDRIIAYDVKSRKRKWEFKPGQSIRFTPSISGNLMIVSTRNINTGVGEISVVELDTGKKQFVIPAEGHPLVLHHRLFVGHRSAFYAFDLSKEGQMLWSYKHPGGWRGWTQPTGSHGLIYAGSASNEILAWDVNNGEVVWRSSLEGLVDYTGHTAPLHMENVIVFRSFKEGLVAFDAKRGKRLWQNNDLHLKPNTELVEGQKVMFVEGYRRRPASATTPDLFVIESLVSAIDVHTGKVAWQIHMDNRMINRRPTIHNNMLFVASDTLYAFDVMLQKKLWEFHPKTTGGTFSNPVFSDNVVYASYGDQLYTIDAKTGQLK